MPNWGKAAQGSLGGAAAGASIGSVVPGIGTAIGAGAGALLGGIGGLFGGGDDLSDQEKARADWLKPYWDSVLQGGAPGYQNSTQLAANDPAMARLLDLSKTGIDPQAAAGYAAANRQAAQLAQGREGAIRSAMQAQGAMGGSGGASLALQQQAAQAGADRAGQMDLGVSADAANRRMQALQGVLSNTNAINQFNLSNYLAKIHALGAAQGNAQMGLDFAQQQTAADQQNFQGTMMGLGRLGNAVATGWGQAAKPSNPQGFNAAPMSNQPNLGVDYSKLGNYFDSPNYFQTSQGQAPQIAASQPARKQSQPQPTY